MKGRSREVRVDFRFWAYDDDYAGPEDRSEALAAEIIPELWYIGSYHSAAYLLKTEAGPVVIDTCSSDAGDFFLSQISRAGVEPSRVAAILHTHAHNDHIGNTARLVELSGAEAMIGAADAIWLAEHTPVKRMLCPGETVQFGSVQLEFCSTPGHTIGCGMYLAGLGGMRVCFMGDACGPLIFQTVRWAGDAESFRASAARMQEVAADLYLPGHPHQILEVSPEGDPRLTGEQWRRYLDRRVDMMEKFIAASDKPQR
jgi:metallo-beta-lactamase class B